MQSRIVSGIKLVRLTTEERNGILHAIQKAAEELAFEWESISLFGSRTDLNKKGGDIDLYLRIVPQKWPQSESHGGSSGDLDRPKLVRGIRVALNEQLGEQKTDIIIDDGVTDLGAFGRLVARDKVDLWIQEKNRLD